MTENESHRVLQFRCAETGRRFIVSFARQGSSGRFHVVSAMDEQEYFGPEPPGAGNPVALLEGTVQKMLVPVFSFVADASKLLQRLRLPAQLDKSATGNRDHESPRGPTPRRPANEHFDISEFDFAGLYCPCCGHGKDKPVQHRFFWCGRCHEYICGARMRTLSDGRTAFACHNRCGNRGVFDPASSSLSSMSGVGFDAQKPSTLADKSRRQLGPGQSLDKRRK